MHFSKVHAPLALVVISGALLSAAAPVGSPMPNAHSPSFVPMPSARGGRQVEYEGSELRSRAKGLNAFEDVLGAVGGGVLGYFTGDPFGGAAQGMNMVDHLQDQHGDGSTKDPTDGKTADQLKAQRTRGFVKRGQASMPGGQQQQQQQQQRRSNDMQAAKKRTEAAPSKSSSRASPEMCDAFHKMKSVYKSISKADEMPKGLLQALHVCADSTWWPEKGGVVITCDDLRSIKRIFESNGHKMSELPDMFTPGPKNCPA